MTQPPDAIIEAARRAAQRSRCAKSNRGAIVYDPRNGRILGRGHNRQPHGFACDNSEACRAACPKLCIHAEDMAIRAIPPGWVEDPELAAQLELVHVKIAPATWERDDVVVPGGGPSCWQCSRLVVEIGLKGVWLFEELPTRYDADGALPPEGEWRFYRGEQFHVLTLKHERNKLPVIEER